MSTESNVVALVPWSMAVRRAAQRRKVFDLLDAKDAGARIRALDPLETYYAVKEVGIEDAAPILAHLGKEQIAVLVDVEAWQRQRFEPDDLLLWLYAFREAGLEALGRAAAAMDREALALLLRRRLFIALESKEDRSDPEPVPEWLQDPADEIMPLVRTPDRRFIIAARVEDELEEEPIDEEDRKGVLQIVDDLYKNESWEDVATVLRLALDDLSSSMEEDALRFRNARLEDYGFPSMARALEIYGPLDPARLDEPPPPPHPIGTIALPARYAAVLNDGLFSAALETIADPKLVTRLEGDLVPVANRALIADGAEPGHLEALTATLTRVKGYIEIALAHGAAPEDRLRTAADRLPRVPLGELVRIGYTITLQLAARARKIALARGLERLDDDDRALFEALGRRRPQLSHLGIERAFGGPDDVLWVDERITRLEGLFAGAETLGVLSHSPSGVIVPPEAERTIDVLVATAAARAVLGEAFLPEPLGGEALADLADRLAAAGGPVFTKADRLRALAPLDALEAPVREALVDEIEGALVRLADVLWPLVGVDRIDPRFVGVVLRRVD